MKRLKNISSKFRSDWSELDKQIALGHVPNNNEEFIYYFSINKSEDDESKNSVQPQRQVSKRSSN